LHFIPLLGETVNRATTVNKPWLVLFEERYQSPSFVEIIAPLQANYLFSINFSFHSPFLSFVLSKADREFSKSFCWMDGMDIPFSSERNFFEIAYYPINIL
jgi:hypothetical protein